MTGPFDPLLHDGGFEFVVNLMSEPWLTFWKQVALVDELEDEVIFAAPSDIVPMLVQSAPQLRKWMKECHCSTPSRYRITVQSLNGDVVCI